MAAVVYLVHDLVFTSKIREAAHHLGVEVTSARDPEALVVGARDARLVIVDLRLPSALDALSGLAADPVAARVPSVGFIDHERTDVMEAARGRGCGQVMAKGQFANALPGLLESLGRRE
jgi:hypothetical protein